MRLVVLPRVSNLTRYPLAWYGPRIGLAVSCVTLLTIQLMSVGNEFYTRSGRRRYLPYISEAGDTGANQVVFVLGTAVSACALLAIVPWVRRMHVYELARTDPLSRRRPPHCCGFIQCAEPEGLSRLAVAMAPVACAGMIGATIINVSWDPYGLHFICALTFFFLFLFYTRCLLAVRHTYVPEPYDRRYRIARGLYYLAWFAFAGIIWTYGFDPTGSASSFCEHLVALALAYAVVVLSDDLFQYEPSVLYNAAAHKPVPAHDGDTSAGVMMPSPVAMVRTVA